MAQHQKPERETREGNGLASDINLRSAARQMDRHPVLQGWLLIGLGTILVLFSFGYFPLLKWAIFAAGIGLSLWGIHKADLVNKAVSLWQSFRKRM